MEFYLASTSHLEDRLWFKCEEDFKVGMNYVAVINHLTGTPVVAFILMSNHVHFVLEGTRKESVRFMNLFKQQYSGYLRRKYGIKEMLRRNDVDIRPVGLADESLERAIAYVMMNSVAANICVHASLYPWGTGGILFNLHSSHGRMLKSFSNRALQKMLHTWQKLPEHYRMADEGYILPDSYVPIAFLESLFRTPNRLNYFLVNSSKAKTRLSQTEVSLPSFRDQSLVAAIPDLCISLFRKNSFKELTEDQKAELVKQIRRRFAADPAQIARVIEVSYDTAAELLDSF